MATSDVQPIKAAVFSSWSHTMGPQMVHMWEPATHSTVPDRRSTDCSQTLAGATQCQMKRKMKRGTFERDVEDLTSQLLHGELHGESTPCNRSKVFVLPGKGLVLHSRVFRTNLESDGSAAPLALTIVYDFRALERMWMYYPIVELCISRTVSSMKKNKKADVGSIINEAMDKFLTTFDKIQTNNGWIRKEYSLASGSSTERPFLERLLCSHLQTGGCSLVLADSEVDANKTMQFLMPFLPVEDRLLAFCNVPDKKWSYSPGILIQALIKDKFGEAAVWVQHMLQNPHPSTIVDVGNKKVRQLMHSSATAQCSWRHREDRSTQQENSTPNALYNKKCNLKSVSQSGHLVPQFLKEMYMLDEGQREIYSRLFVRHLAIKSAAAVRIADCIRKTPSGIQSSEMKKNLGIADSLDLRVVLGSAQRLHPDAISWAGK